MSNSSVQFTVIIPTYNAAGTIVRALDSVLGQSYAPLQVVVVDDASKDNTVALIQETYGGRVNVIEKITNSGSSAARNAGMDVARGDYIAFLDADDVWHKDKLLLLNTILSAQRNIALFYHPFTQEDLGSKKLPEAITMYKLPFVKLLPGNRIATSCMVLRNDKAFRFVPDMRYTEDFDLALQVGYKHGIYFVDIPLTQIFREFTSKGGISENRWKMRKGEMRAYTRLLKLNPLFALLWPFLIVGSFGKHVVKMVK